MPDETAQTAAQKRRTGRSPAYPYISVKKALEQAKALLDQEGEYAAPLASAVKAWGYSAKSSGGRQTLATMKYYGLIDISGEGDGRKIKVSPIALQILRDPREDQSEKNERIRRVALTPVAHKALYEAFPNGLASDGSVLHFLMQDQEFKPDAAKELLAEFKETASFINLYRPSNLVDKKDEKRADDSSEDELPSVAVGDRIQWVSGGAEQFQTPATVLGLSDDGLWVFTDQGHAAVPVSEIAIMERSVPPTPPGNIPPPIPPHILAALKAKEEALDEGESVLTRGKLAGGSFKVLVKGDIGAKEIAKIIKMLDAQKAILSDDDEDGAAN